MTKREPKSKLEIPTRKAGPKGRGFANLRTPEQVESIPFEELVSVPDSLSTVNSLVTENSLPTQTSQFIEQPEAYSENSLVSKNSLLTVNSQPPTLAEIAEDLSYGAGHSRLNHDFFDDVLAKLSANEQLLYIHLFRYRERSANTTVRLSLPTLAKRTGLSKSTIQRAETSLAAKGMIEKLDVEFGYHKEQGRRYRLFIPNSLRTPNSQFRENSLVKVNSIKERVKENNKKGSELALDTKNCPDCDGMGVRYIDPLDYSKGTIKCKHERMGTT
jgi:predicted transcriptional regulator